MALKAMNDSEKNVQNINTNGDNIKREFFIVKGKHRRKQLEKIQIKSNDGENIYARMAKCH